MLKRVIMLILLIAVFTVIGLVEARAQECTSCQKLQAAQQAYQDASYGNVRQGPRGLLEGDPYQVSSVSLPQERISAGASDSLYEMLKGSNQWLRSEVERLRFEIETLKNELQSPELGALSPDEVAPLIESQLNLIEELRDKNIRLKTENQELIKAIDLLEETAGGADIKEFGNNTASATPDIELLTEIKNLQGQITGLEAEKVKIEESLAQATQEAQVPQESKPASSADEVRNLKAELEALRLQNKRLIGNKTSLEDTITQMEEQLGEVVSE